MTKNEKDLIRAAEHLFDALERCVKWYGTGSTRQEQAHNAREKAVLKWRSTLERLETETTP